MVLNLDFWTRRVGRPVLHALVALPLATLVARALGHLGGLGANPIATLTDLLGLWGLRCLLASLAMTPLRTLTGSPRWLLYRRMLGLWGFAYLTLHLSMYVLVDQRLDLPVLVEDVLKRPWITIGFVGWVLLVPLTVTSLPALVRRLGARRWRLLHKTAYLIALLGVWHYYWQVKRDIRPPLLYAAIYALLMGARLLRLRARSAPATAPGRT